MGSIDKLNAELGVPLPKSHIATLIDPGFLADRPTPSVVHQRRSILSILTTSLVIIWISGCQPENPSATNPRHTRGQEQTLSQSEQATEKNEIASELATLENERHNNIDQAIKKAASLLVRFPDDPRVLFAAAKTFLLANKTNQAIELLDSISEQSDLINEASRLLVTALKQKDDERKSTEHAATEQKLSHQKLLPELRDRVTDRPTNLVLRDALWRELNRHGLREEACRHADFLCTIGKATPEHLISLLQRNLSFPISLPEGSKPDTVFHQGLGISRWRYSNGNLTEAIEELRNHQLAATTTQAETAFLGRLLSEAQNYGAFSDWIVSCNAETQIHGDFWAALGTFFLDQHQDEAATRCLMEALLRDPTDERSAHRLAKALDAMGRTEDAKQARHRAVIIVQLKNEIPRLSAEQLGETQTISERLLELGRPFEALNWKLLAKDSAAATPVAAALRQQITQMSQNQAALTMAFEMSQLDLSRATFEIAPELISNLKSDTRVFLTVQNNPASLQSNPHLASKVNPRENSIKNDHPQATWELTDVADKVGLNFQWYKDLENDFSSIPLHEVMGGGVAVIDYELDGWPDVYLAQGSGEPPHQSGTRSNQLFRNLAGSFDTVTDLSNSSDHNYSSGIAAGDVNQDGFPDLWIGNLGKSRLLVNNGDGTFRDDSETLGLETDLFTSSVAIADLTQDGLPDLFEVAYVEMEGGFREPGKGADDKYIVPSPLSFYASPDRWLENRGDGTWVARTISSDRIEPGTGLGVLISDFDQDGINEVFVANDGRANHLLKIKRDRSVDNLAELSGLSAGFDGGFSACMGIASGDFDRNGRQDLHLSNFSQQSNHHFLQLSQNLFTDLAVQFRHADWSSLYVGFGIKAMDIDRNGWLDLIATNGHIFDLTDRGEPLQMPGQVIMNDGGRFEWSRTESPSQYWQNQHIGRAISKIDFNRDHRIDFLVSHLDHPVALLENQTESPANWIQFELIGTQTERDAVGTRVRVQAGEQSWTEWVTAGDGYLSSDQKLIDIGIGSADQIDSVSVTWPSGVKYQWENLTPNRRLMIIENQTGEPMEITIPSAWPSIANAP